MITVHHLDYSRSTRILWLLEELGEEYDLKVYHRDRKTFRAPPELKEASPLGKAPAIEVDGHTIGESGAILEYLAATLGDGRLARGPSDADWASYLEWLHFGEGSAMLGVILTMVSRGEADTGAARYGREVASDAMDLMDRTLAGQDYLLPSGFSAADIQNGYVAASAESFGFLEGRTHVRAWLDRLLARDGLKAALEKGGPWTLSSLREKD